MFAQSALKVVREAYAALFCLRTAENVDGNHVSNGRAGEIRTHDLLHPMQARYQATLQPEQKEGQKAPWRGSKQALFPASGRAICSRPSRRHVN